MSVAGQVIISGAIGGTAEALGGGKFANGAVTGAYVMMFNHLSGSGDKNEEQIALIELPEIEIMADGIYFINDKGEKVWWASIETGRKVSIDGSTVITISKSIIKDENARSYFQDQTSYYSNTGHIIGLAGGITSIHFLRISPVIGTYGFVFTGIATTYCFVKSTTYTNMGFHYLDQTNRPGIMVITTQITSTRGGIFNHHVRRDYYWQRGSLVRSVIN